MPTTYALNGVNFENQEFTPSSDCAIWRRFCETGEELAVRGLANLKRIADEVDARRDSGMGLQLAD